MILVHKKDPHDWQGDVISDLKRPRDFWPDDWEIDAKNVKIISHEPKPKRRLSDIRLSDSENTHSPMYARSTSLSQMSDGQPHVPADTSMMSHMADQDRNEPLSLVQTPVSMQMMSNPAAPIPSVSSTVTHMPHQDHMGTHHSPPNSAVEMAAASILNLSSQLPPLPPPMSHMSSVPMDGQMPSILNLSTMHNMSYSHHSTT